MLKCYCNIIPYLHTFILAIDTRIWRVRARHLLFQAEYLLSCGALIPVLPRHYTRAELTLWLDSLARSAPNVTYVAVTCFLGSIVLDSTTGVRIRLGLNLLASTQSVWRFPSDEGVRVFLWDLPHPIVNNMRYISTNIFRITHLIKFVSNLLRFYT